VLSAIESITKPRSSYVPIMSVNRVVILAEVFLLWNVLLIEMTLSLDVPMLSCSCVSRHMQFFFCTNVDSMLATLSGSPVSLIKRVQGMIEAFIYSLSDSSDFSLYIHCGALLSGAVKIMYYRPGGYK
jgi:hypothetical protein